MEIGQLSVPEINPVFEAAGAATGLAPAAAAGSVSALTAAATASRPAPNVLVTARILPPGAVAITNLHLGRRRGDVGWEHMSTKCLVEPGEDPGRAIVTRALRALQGCSGTGDQAG